MPDFAKRIRGQIEGLGSPQEETEQVFNEEQSLPQEQPKPLGFADRVKSRLQTSESFKNPISRKDYTLENIPDQFDTKPIFQEPETQKVNPNQKAQAQSFLPPEVYNAVDTFLFKPFERVYDNLGAGVKSFNQSFYLGLREISKVVEEATGAEHNASDFFDQVARSIEKSGITPQSDHWADQVVFMIGNALPSAGLGIGAGALAQNVTRTLAGASAKVAPVMARFLGEAAAGAFEGTGRAAQVNQDIGKGAVEGANQFALFELANSFGSRYGKAFQIGFSTALGGSMAALSPDSTKDDILAASILGAVFAIPGRTKSGDIKTDLGNIMSWVKRKRKQGVDPTPSMYIEEIHPASVEQASNDSIMSPYYKTDQSPYDEFKSNVAREVGIDPDKITDNQVYSKLSDEMGADGAAATLNSLKRQSDIWVSSQVSPKKQIVDLDTIENLKNKISLKSSEIDSINSKIENNQKKSISGDISYIIEINRLSNIKSKIDNEISELNKELLDQERLLSISKKDTFAGESIVLDPFNEKKVAESPIKVRDRVLNDLVKVNENGRDVIVPRRIENQIPKIKRNIESVQKREAELEASLVKKPAENLSNRINKVADAFLNVERRIEAEFEKFPEGQNILLLRGIQQSATSISELNVNDALKAVGLTGKNKMSAEMMRDFQDVANALTQIDKIKRQSEYKSPLGTGQKAIDQYEFIVNDRKSKYQSLGSGNDFQNRLDTYFGIYKKYLKDAHTSGILSDTDYKNMKDIAYSPTQYIEFLQKKLDFDPDYQRQQLFGVKKLGSGKNDVNITKPEYLLSGHINIFDYMIAKNNHLKATHEFILAHPENAIGSVGQKEGFNKRVAYKNKGKVQEFYISDDFAKGYEIDSLFSENYSTIVKSAQYLSGSAVVKQFSTGVFAPDYFIASIPRDFFFFNMNNYWKGQTNILPLDIAKAAIGIPARGLDALLKTEKYKQFVRAGGASSVEANEMKRLSFKERDARFIGPKNKFAKYYDKVIDGLMKGNHTAEIAVRMHFADLIYNNGNNGIKYEHAVNESSRMLDFRRRGPASEMIEIAVPYFNVTTQSMERFYRGYKKHSQTGNKKLYMAKTAQWLAASYMLASFPYWYAERYGDEESKKEILRSLDTLSLEDKLKNVMIPIGHHDVDNDGNRAEYFYKLKKEQFPLTTALDGIVHSILDYQYLGREPDEDMWREIYDAAVPYDVHNFIPPTGKFVLAVTGNFDATFNRTISDPNIPETERINNASPFSIAVGQKLGLSPEGLDVGARQLGIANPFLKGAATLSGSFLSNMLGMNFEGFSPEAERDLARAFTESPFTNRFITKTTFGNRLMKDLDKMQEDLMTLQQRKVNQPVTDMIERIKNKEIDGYNAVYEISKSEGLSPMERKSAQEKVKNFVEGDELYKRLSQSERFKENKGELGYLTAWRKYHALFSKISDGEAGKTAAKYVVDRFLNVDDGREIRGTIRNLGLVYLPKKHRAAFSEEFRKLTEGK